MPGEIQSKDSRYADKDKRCGLSNFDRNCSHSRRLFQWLPMCFVRAILMASICRHHTRRSRKQFKFWTGARGWSNNHLLRSVESNRKHAYPFDSTSPSKTHWLHRCVYEWNSRYIWRFFFISFSISLRIKILV